MRLTEASLQRPLLYAREGYVWKHSIEDGAQLCTPCNNLYDKVECLYVLFTVFDLLISETCEIDVCCTDLACAYFFNSKFLCFLMIHPLQLPISNE